jgi:MATE family multidrug resistance protein
LTIRSAHLAHQGAILRISAPIFIAQIAVMANAVADTIIAGHYHADHLAAIGLGSAIWASVFIPLMGIVQGLSPIIARFHGARQPLEIGRHVRAGTWIALALSALMMAAFSRPDFMLEWAQIPPAVLPLSRRYLQLLAFGVPALMLARVFYSFAPAVDHPRAVMAINIAGLCLKIPLSYAFVNGAWGFPELGGPGCGLASAIAFWLMFGVAFSLLRLDPSYRRFAVWGHGWRFDPGAVWRILRLGTPIGMSIAIEVTSFVFMALFLARLGATVSGAQQIVSNFAAFLFMLPLSLGIGTQVLIGQNLGAKKGREAREVALDGMRMAAGLATLVIVVVAIGRREIVALYTSDPGVAVLALELLTILVVFHWFDAIQCLATQALRGYQQTWIPMLIYAISLWGIGMGVGYVLAFAHWPGGGEIRWLQPLGAAGFWYAQTASLVVAGSALYWEFGRVSRRFARAATPPVSESRGGAD